MAEHLTSTLNPYQQADLELADFRICPDIGPQTNYEPKICLSGVTAYINAGGRGTRLNSILSPDPRFGITKALLSVGVPEIYLIDHHINKLLAVGMPNIVVGAGDQEPLSDHVIDEYGKNSNVKVIYSPAQYGTGGDLLTAIDKNPDLFQDHIAINNVDTLIDLNENDMLNFHLEHEADLTIALTLNKGVPNQDAYSVDAFGKVIHCAEADLKLITDQLTKRIAYQGSSTGSIIVKKDLLKLYRREECLSTISLYQEIVRFALETSLVCAFNNGNRFFTDVGTVSAWNDVQDSAMLIEQYLKR